MKWSTVLSYASGVASAVLAVDKLLPFLPFTPAPWIAPVLAAATVGAQYILHVSPSPYAQAINEAAGVAAAAAQAATAAKGKTP